MKRGREDGLNGASVKRPASGIGRPTQGSQAGAASNAAANRLTTNDALSYLRDVKQKFSDNKEVYDTFLEIMKKFKAQRINTEGVIDQVKSLFKGHRELILGFNTFLPKGYEIHMPPEEEEPPKAAVEFDQAINYVNKIKTRFANDERVYKAFLEILNMYRKGQKTITNVYEEVALLFRNHQDLLDEFTYFLPDSTPPAQQQAAPVKRIQPRGGKLEGRRVAANGDADYRPGGRTSLAKELSYFEKVKQRMRNRETYQEFLKTLNLFAQEIITKQELHIMVQDILGRAPDLTGGFNEFLARCENLDFDVDSARGRLSAREVRNLKMSQGDKYLLRPVSELDVSTWERCTTSYVKLPKGYPKMVASQRTPLGNLVLQDDWVSVTSGSEDYSFKHMRKNQYEEALFRCEDDRFELDMAIECSLSAIRAMQPLAEAANKLDGEDKERFRLPPDSVLPIHYRMVQKIYAEQGLAMVDLLRKNPAVTLNIVLARLIQKVDEWQSDKRKMTDVWQKMYDANYHKSLDHRSFYFKQTDKRNLGQKTMMQEIKDISEKRRQEDNGLQLVRASANFAARLAPDLSFNCKDRVVHDDVMRVIKYSVEEMLSSDAAERALEFWCQSVEPFFGLPPRAKEEPTVKVEDAVEEAKSPKASLSAFRLQALSGDNGADSAAPSVTDEGDKEDPSVLDAIGEIASGRVADGTVKMEPGAGSEERIGDTDARDSDDPEDAAEGRRVEGEVSDEEPDKAYLSCKPLAPAEEVRKSHQAVVVPQAGRVFYGNDPFYHFYRLHQHLYDRLRQARKCSLQVGSPSFRIKSEHEQEEAISHLDDHAAGVHGRFMQLVFDLIDGTHDSSAYEDACRSLLGTNSYVLFTLDKLIYKVVKQLQSLLADDLACKLLDLYAYESSRTVPSLDAVYYQNAHVLLHDDNCFRLETRPDGLLTMQLLEADRSEVVAGVLQPEFARYLDTYTDTPAGSSIETPDGTKRQPFLRRSIPVPMEASGLAPQDREVQALEGTEIVNGLECKLSTATSKVSYVLDTEDSFRRIKPSSGRANGVDAASQRTSRFNDWLRRTAEAAAAAPAAALPRAPLPPMAAQPVI